MSEKNSWLFRVQNASIHPSINLSRVRPPVHSSRVLVRSSRETRRNETYFFRFIFSFRAERLGSVARARNAARFRPRASPRWKKFPSSIQSAPTDAADVVARTTRSRNERRREQTQHYFLLPFLLHPRAVRVRRVAECRAVSPCRPSYTRLVVSNRRFSRKQTRVISPLVRVTTNERGHSNEIKKVRARLCFLNFLCVVDRVVVVVVVVVCHRRSERGEDVPHARNESSHRFRSVKQRPASTLVVVANGAEAHHRRW